MSRPGVNLQVAVTPWMAEAIDSLVGTVYGQTRAEIARYLLRVGYLYQQQALEAERDKVRAKEQA